MVSNVLSYIIEGLEICILLALFVIVVLLVKSIVEDWIRAWEKENHGGKHDSVEIDL